MFYKEMYNQDPSYHLKFSRKIEFSDGDTIMTCIDPVYQKIYQRYDIDMIQLNDNCMLFVIQDEK